MKEKEEEDKENSKKAQNSNGPQEGTIGLEEK